MFNNAIIWIYQLLLYLSINFVVFSHWSRCPSVCLYNRWCCDISCVPAVSVHFSGLEQMLAQKLADTKLFQGKSKKKNSAIKNKS